MEESVLDPHSDNKLHEPSSHSVDEDDPPVLSAHALAALKEFLAEQNHQSVSDPDVANEEKLKEVALVSENWRLSQFWYSPDTAMTLAQEVVALCEGHNCRVACVACPTLYAYLKQTNHDISAQILEFDKRFEQYGSDYTFYDYNQPEELPSELKHAYKVLVADPPYLSKECLEKVALTVSFLAQPGESFLLLLTGEVQKDRAAELLALHPCGFRPQHSSKLGNEFRLFTNYNPGTRLGGWEK